MRSTIGPMLGVAFYLVGCGTQAEAALAGGGGLDDQGPGGSGGSIGSAGGAGGSGAGEAAPLVWTATELGMMIEAVACDERGTCLGLSGGPDEVRLVDLDSGIEQTWSPPERWAGDLRFGSLVGRDGRFFLSGGAIYDAGVLERTEAGIELVWASYGPDGCAPPPAQCPTTSSPFTSIALAEGSVWALHWDGTVLRGHDGAWQLIGSTGSGFYDDLSGTEDGSLFGAGAEGISRFDGGAFALIQRADGLTSLWSDGAGFVAGVGYDGRVIHGDEQGFQSEQLGGGELLDVWGASRDEVWAVGGEGRVLRFDGASWQPEVLPVAAEGRFFVSVTGAANGDVIAVSGDGLVLRGARPAR